MVVTREFNHLLKASVMLRARRMSDCSRMSFSFMFWAYDSDPGLGGLHIMPKASWPVTLGERLMEHSLYISFDTLHARREKESYTITCVRIIRNKNMAK